MTLLLRHPTSSSFLAQVIKSEKKVSETCPIWMMWYQGIEKAPPLVLACIQSVIKNRAKHPIIIINKYNIDKYIELPKYIIEKFNNKTFSVTHFSDIVRFALLFKYGGYWIDSTYFITTSLDKINLSYFTLKINKCWTHSIFFINCLWAGNFFAVSKNSFLATYGYIAFLYYWKKYNSLINYFLIDYIIYIAYEKLPEFQHKINILPNITCNIFSLKHALNLEHKKSDIKCPFNKLKKRGKWKYFINKTETNYGYIIRHYLTDSQKY